MDVWRIVSAALAVLLLLVVLRKLARSRQAHSLVEAAQLALIPEVAFISYAVAPAALPNLSVVIPTFVAVYVLAVAALLWSGRVRNQLTQPSITYDVLQRQHVAALVVQIASVGLITVLVFGFEPWLAVANIVANSAWALAWAPRRWRHVHFEISVDVGVPPEDAFAFVSDTANHPTYRDDFVRAEPPGKLAVGTRLVTRRAMDYEWAPPATLASSVEVTTVITSVSPGKGYTAAVAGHPGLIGTTEFLPSDAGTSVVTSSDGSYTFPQAVLGWVLESSRALIGREAEARRTAIRLKEVLEGLPLHQHR